MENYEQFILTKTRKAKSHGFEPIPFVAPLFDWQKIVVTWAVRQGRAALFEDCGLGKTIQQLEWARQVAEHSKAPVLLLTPLSVAHQTAQEAIRFGIKTKVAASQDDVDGQGIYITNYDKLHHFTPEVFSGVVLDESSILKNFTGKIRKMLTDSFADTPYRLACTATPAPNDYMEFGQHAEFLGVMPSNEMLCRFFINDTMNFGSYRLKGHAEGEFWEWVASWSACISNPEDIGFDGSNYILPKLNLKNITVDVDDLEGAADGELFRVPDMNATTIHKEMRISNKERCKATADMVNNSNEHWLIWCNTNYEAEELARLIPDAVEICGGDTSRFKEAATDWFLGYELADDELRLIGKQINIDVCGNRNTGESVCLGIQDPIYGNPLNTSKRILISKPGICGYGMNFQHCNNVAFVGLSYSFEDFYQALRRSYRFGQKKEVNAWVIQGKNEGQVLAVINRKIDQHKQMQQAMKQAAAAFRNEQDKQLKMKTDITIKKGENWTLANADCVRFAQTLEDNSIDFSVYSPPFASLYIYSSDAQDMGNCKDDSEFMEHYKFLIKEKLRITKPGCLTAVHCKNLVNYANRDGHAGLRDFRGEIIKAHTELGWAYHSEVTIWKDPVIEMQRTKAQGLLYKQLRQNSKYTRNGMAEYLMIFRKWGEKEVMDENPVTHTKDNFPLDQWQQWASPVWMDIRQTRVLNIQQARDDKDEKHICPLQLDVIERALVLWSNEGDLVYSPFSGIGSEGYCSLKFNRRFIGSELKEQYWRTACGNLMQAENDSVDLFSLK